jgi:hypothetical protein
LLAVPQRGAVLLLSSRVNIWCQLVADGCIPALVYGPLNWVTFGCKPQCLPVVSLTVHKVVCVFPTVHKMLVKQVGSSSALQCAAIHASFHGVSLRVTLRLVANMMLLATTE